MADDADKPDAGKKRDGSRDAENLADLPPEEERQLRVGDELAALRKAVEQTSLEAEGEIAKLNRDAEMARLDADEKIASVRARTRAALRQARTAADRLAREDIRTESAYRGGPYRSRGERSYAIDDDLFDVTGVEDAYSTLIDMIAAVSRSYTIALADGFQAATDAASVCGDTTSRRIRSRIADDGPTEPTRYADRGRRATYRTRGRRPDRVTRRRTRVTSLPTDIYAGWRDAFDELIDVPARAFDSFYDAYNEMRPR